jgi:hypothetical protein
MRAAVALAALLLSTSAQAQVAVTVNLNAEGDMLAQQLGVTSSELATRIQSAINSAYGTMNVDGFLRSFADATAFSMRGLGVDYASDPDSIVLGVGANFAVAASDQVDAAERPTAGLAANIAFMAGLNLSQQGAPRWTLFANGFYRKGGTASLRGDILSAGFHAQYRLIQPQPTAGAAAAVVRWMGVDLTSGLELTRWSLDVDDAIDTPFGVQGTNASANLTVASTGTFALRSQAMTIPIELTTSIRIALLVSTYVGVGLDFTTGTGRLDADLAGTMRTSDNRDVGTVGITGGGDNSASPIAARVLTGVQLNLWKIKIYSQLNASATPAASVGFGIRGVL